MIKKTLHITDTRKLLGAKPTLRCPVPEYLYLATSNARCNKVEIFIKPGDHVLLNQVIGMRHAAFFDQPIHSTCSGEFIGYEKHYHRSGKLTDFIKIKNDFKDDKDPSYKLRSEEEIQNMSKDEMTEIIKNCACVGLGGSSFPTYIKFQTKNKINAILINDIECEPYISSDHTVTLEETYRILDGIRYLQWAFKCKKVLICIKCIYKDLEHALNVALQHPRYKDTGIEVKKVGNFYPQGWEIAMIKNATGIQVPSGHLPSEFGIINFNVSTVIGIYFALKYNTPIFSRRVTVTGDGINSHSDFIVRIGTPVKYLIDACGGYKDEEKDKVIILGGPMMGASVPSDDCICTKTVTSIIVLNEGKQEIEEPCVRCGSCVLSCPVGLMPVDIIKTMQHAPVNLEKLKALNPKACIGCGLCTYSCTSKIDVKKYVETAKLIASKVK